MKNAVKHIFCAVCIGGLIGATSTLRAQTSDTSSSDRLERIALQDTNPPGPPSAPQPDTAVPPPAGAASDKIVELTRGPLNQGFAEMTNMTPQPSPPVAKEPPAPIDESPPDVRPDNPESTWVPGYWSWDAESNHYIWVSGSWRVPPPGHRWIPGYWSGSDGNFQWVSGFWSPGEVEEVTYLPAPPPYRDEDVDVSSPPDAEHFWVPGYWAYRTQAYEWQPGYWSRVVAGWMWIPAHYQWTPYGYVFIAGHWDYPLVRRGILFAPVSFAAPIYLNRAFVYTPINVVALNALVDNLFVAPGYQSYFFGDYYGPQYARFGIYPWFNVGVGPYLYDPIFAYRSSLLWRTNPHWRDDFRRRYDRLVRDPALRPPRTWHDYQRLVRDGKTLPRDRMVALPLREAVRDKNFNEHIVHLSEVDRRDLRQQNEFRRNLVTERRRLERANNVERQVERRPGERVPEGRVPRSEERPGVRPEERPGQRPGPKPERREGPGIAEAPRAPRTLRFKGEPGHGEPRVEERREGPKGPNVRQERPGRANIPRPPQPDRGVRAPAARPAPERNERERK